MEKIKEEVSMKDGAEFGMAVTMPEIKELYNDAVRACNATIGDFNQDQSKRNELAYKHAGKNYYSIVRESIVI
tara:strand:+ start:33 stop:251 length:219 start_codon:yes stop_codon:yes gene_type:complete